MKNVKNNQQPKKKTCFFSSNNVYYIDYKDIEMLNKFTSYYGKIESAGRTGTKRKHQTRLARAIKRARFMSLLPYYTQ